MKTFLDQNDLRRLITRIKESLGLKADKTAIPTKLSDLEDDSVQNPIAYASESNWASSSGYADGAYMSACSIGDVDGDNIKETYATKKEVSTVESIAKGRATGYVFDTLSDLETWLEDSENTAKLVLGDNLYIRTTDVPDYWWDGAEKQILETQKVDLTEYAKTENVPTKLSDLEDDATVEHALVADNAAVADTSWADGLGNSINETYATKSELGDVEEALNDSIALCDSYISWEVPV